MRVATPELVGRTHELGVAVDALRAARTGRGGALLVAGPPGTGKSRLAKEVAARAHDDGMTVLRGRGSALGPAVPFRPIREALLSLARTHRLDGEALGPYRAVLGRLVPEWHSDDVQHEHASLVVLAEAVLRVLAVAGADGGCVLVLDDLHEVDAETLAVVEYVADNLESAPVVLLATLRSDPGPALELATSLERRQAAELVELGPLTEADVLALLASCLRVPVDEVPAPLAGTIPRDSAGNPFVAEELVRGMVGDGVLVRGGDGWSVVGDVARPVPQSLVRLITSRVERLGPHGRTVLAAAAVLGRRFPVSVLSRATGLDDAALFGHLHAAVSARFVTPDDTSPDWYVFEHPLTAEALLSEVSPAERAATSGRAAAAIQEAASTDPERRHLLATLLRAAGRPQEAAEELMDAGRRAVGEGALGSAVRFVQEAVDLLATHGDPRRHARAVDLLLATLVEAGRIDQALELAASWDAGGYAPRGRERADLHVRLAWVALHAHRDADVLSQVEAALDCLGPDPSDADRAAVDAVLAAHALTDARENRLAEAWELASRAADTAQEHGLAEVACQALQTVGTVARERRLQDSVAAFDRAQRIAEAADLPVWRLYAMVGAAGSRWLADGDAAELVRARDEAMRAGAVHMAMVVRGILGIDHVLRGRFAEAGRELDEVVTEALRMRAASVVVYGLMGRCVLEAHRGGPDLRTHLAAFAEQGGERSREMPLVVGLARAVGALLAEDRDLARRELAVVRELQSTSSTSFHLTGQYGLGVLLDALAGDATAEEVRRVRSTAAGGMRWNRQFLTLADAVLAGRGGQDERATALVDEALGDAAPYPAARALGLRLVGEAAVADGWGRPAEWLREAEDQAHRVGAGAVASACRAMLRRLGETVRQRREGTDRVPEELRQHGVTIREYEVLELLVHRLTNRELAARLHISPRTVEKHVASLMLKTGHEDRAALAEFAGSRGRATGSG
ncbi:ATP-binding protein [Thalassiella azotivora]